MIPPPGQRPLPLGVPSTRRRRRIAVGAAVLAAAALGTGVAAATGILAYTVERATGGENGTGEYIRLDAPDAPQALTALLSDLPLPPTMTVDDLVRQYTGASGPTQQIDIGIRGTSQMQVACAWADYWIHAAQCGDAQAMAQAQTVIDQVPTWADLVAADGGNIVAGWRNIAAEMRTGDPVVVLASPSYDINC